MSSAAIATYPFVGAFRAAEGILGGPIREWGHQNAQQAGLLANIVHQGWNDTVPELASIGSWDAQEINQFLTEHGFSIQLDPFQPYEFGMASKLELLLEWEREGEVSKIREYPAVNKQDHTVFFHTSVHAYPIVTLETTSQDQVHLTVAGHKLQGPQLAHYARTIMGSTLAPTYEFQGVKFPMVNLNIAEAMEWLLGMRFGRNKGDMNTVSQALQQNILKLNHQGVLAKSAVAMGAYRGTSSGPKPLVIDQPFLIWITRPGMTLPLFVAYVDTDSWEDPGELV